MGRITLQFGVLGLEKDELERLARGWSSLGCVKVSRRDVAHTIWRGLNGGTTVSSTMLLAHQAGIKLFATGGIGGVHRDGQNCRRTLCVQAQL